MTAERDASQTQPSQSAALRGASQAFGNAQKELEKEKAKPALKPKPHYVYNENGVGSNGALVAATKSSSRTRDETQRLAYQRSGGSTSSGQGPWTPELERRLGHEGMDKVISPSFIAATLAASRSVTPNHTGQGLALGARQIGRSPSQMSMRSVSSRGSLRDQGLDVSSIPPTGALIGMFEQNSERQGSAKKKRVVAKRPDSGKGNVKDTGTENLQTPARVRKPSPLVRRPDIPDAKSTSPEPQMLNTPNRERRPSPLANKPQRPPSRRVETKAESSETQRTSTHIRRPSSQAKKFTKPEIRSPKPLLSPTLPPKSSDSMEPKTNPIPASRRPSVIPANKPNRETPVLEATRPIPIPKAQAQAEESDSSEDSFVSASSHTPDHYPDPSPPPSFRVSLQQQNQRRQSSHSSNPSPAQINAMANAIVASSLASSRAASPSRSSHYPPPPPPRRSPHKHHLPIFHNNPSPPKSSSPVKASGLRTTMRKPKLNEEEDEGALRRGRRKKMMRKHPNKHHEGDRKRWRDEITARERKRYEAVWASNRGIFLPPSSSNIQDKSQDEVCNLVVRDIWSRSRLNAEVLEEVYALVDRRGGGSLGREEFVVGMWLVDQRLKGRKLPVRVGESVWGSVGLLGGVKVRVGK